MASSGKGLKVANFNGRYHSSNSDCFRRPQKATNSKMTGDGILLRYREDELVGITILDVSARIEV